MIREHILHEIKIRYARAAYDEKDIWDVVLATGGLTVFMMDGTMLPIPLPKSAADVLYLRWALTAKAN